MKIAISGYPGSGKTTIGKMLAEELGLEFISIGNLRGKMATERGMTIEELNKLGETESWTDREVDEYQKKYGETHDDFVAEGRLAFYFIPDSIKVFLTVDPRLSAERIWKNPRPDEIKRESVEDEMKAISERVESDKKRYQKYYGVNPYDLKKFDVAVDTSQLDANQVLQKILIEIKKLKK